MMAPDGKQRLTDCANTEPSSCAETAEAKAVTPTPSWVKLYHVKIIIEKHLEGYVAYPAGLQGVVVGQGKTYEEALRDIQSAIRFHIETFGSDALESESPALDAFVAEASG
jgi:predicted RNase H-like HicB family nuclease